MTLPIDVTSALIRESNISTSTQTSFTLESWAIARATSALQEGARPLIFAGAGVKMGDGPTRLREVAERLQCPVMTTPKAKGVFPEDHPLSLGVFGIGGHPSATDYLKNGIDTLLAIGTSLGELSTNGWSTLLTPKLEFIHVDIDANQIGKCYPANLSIVAPADEFLRAVRDRLPAKPSRPRTVFGVQTYQSFDEIAATPRPGRRITPQRALWELQQILPSNTIFACDVGEFSVFATHYIRTNAPDGWVFMNGLGSMGQSFGTALGAKLGRPDRTVAVVCGDAGFSMMVGELATIAAEQIPLVIIVMNDARMGMVELGNTGVFGRTHAFAGGPADIATVARGFGLQSRVVVGAGDGLATAPVLADGGPVVIDVQIDRDERMPKHTRFETFEGARRGLPN